MFTYGGGANDPPAVFSPGPSTQFTLTLHIFDPSVPDPGKVDFQGEF